MNNVKVRIHFSLPDIGDDFEEIHGVTIFATFDLANGYLQIPFSNKEKEKTAYRTLDVRVIECAVLFQ